MPDFKIEYLADHPQHIQACAAWDFGHWNVQKSDKTFEGSLRECKENAQKETLPIGVIALNTLNDLPIGMGFLRPSDNSKWDKLYTPWISTVFVHYRYRNQGIARAIVERLEQETKRLGFETMYLYSGSAADLYPKLGYTMIDKEATELSNTGYHCLFEKKL